MSAQKQSNAKHDYTLASAEELIEEARNGRMIILVDDEDRENEGDLVIPAQMATPDMINFMATHGRGLICLAMEEAMIERLGLPMMAQRNTSGFGTAFTVSIEAKEGVSTGISAPDRARTIQVAIDPASTHMDIAMPGHVFPLKAQKGGVLVRAGHTEAAVDLSRAAGFSGAGVICEVMKEDGSMARLNDLVGFAKTHNIKLGTIADLISYRLRKECCVEWLGDDEIESRYGGTFTLKTYRNTLNGQEHSVLVKGEITTHQPSLVRVHAMNMRSDLLGIGDDVLHQSMRAVDVHGSGIIVLLRGEGMQDQQPASGQGAPMLRHYGIGAQILRHLGVTDMVLLTKSPKNIVGLQGYGLNIIDQKWIEA